ncbi:MAG: transglutaminase-like putative cysteine protease [Cellvibrionaceae bacterium]
MSRRIFIHRQALLGLLLAQMSAMLLHGSRLPLWLWLLVIIAFIWQIQIYRNQWAFPNKLLRSLLVCSSIILIVFYYRDWYALEPMTIMLILASVLKLLEVRYQRDALVVIYVGYLITACAFLFDQSIVISLAGLFTLGLLTACLFILQTRHHNFLSRQALYKVFILLLQALPIMLLILFIFPRVGSLWSLPLQGKHALTGISDSMSPGDFSQLSRSRELAFRISFTGDRVPEPNKRYWRGLVLTDFDGRRWQRQTNLSVNAAFSKEAEDRPQFAVLPDTTVYDYEVIMEASSNPWVYAMPLATVINQTHKRTDTNELILEEPVNQRIRYEVRSNLQFSIAESQKNLQQALLLPEDFNPKSLTRAREWRQASSSEEDYIGRVLRFYNERFYYTLSPPPLGTHSVDEFLFSTQRGFCEHFSSSFVVLMRAAGIPARVITGYQGGEWKATDNYLVVRQYDAHAWAEVWLSERGWIRIDPTAMVAPERIEQGLLESLSEEDQRLIDSGSLPSLAWVNHLVSRWGSVNYRWQRWVLSYNEQKQSELLKKLLGQVTPSRVALLMIVPALAILLLMAFLTLRTTSKPISRSAKLYFLFVKILRKRGVNCDYSDTPLEIGKKARGVLANKDREIATVVMHLNRTLYTDTDALDSKHWATLKRMIVALR